jgi:tRNA-2-methylthio-N6-dimethylallyladenosine synthase
MEKKVYIQTFGCQMNVHDSEQIITLLRERGYAETRHPGDADVILVNTCSIREKAAQKVYSQLGRFAIFKRQNPDLLIGVGGCLAQQFAGAMLRKAPFIDVIFGTHNNHLVADLLEKVRVTKRPVVEVAFRESVPSLGIVPPPAKGAISSFVTIMQGCNNFCSFCIVPYVRGREQSRSSRDIIEEIKILADGGVKEVTLLGQNVNSYGSTLAGNCNFPQLLQSINGIDGICRIRFTTSHPKDLSDDLMACFGSLEKLCEHIHLPVQSGADRILQRMNRRYTRKDYLEKINRLRSFCPRISITSDVIVGFPGETEGDFQDTIDLMNEVRFDGLFSFQYSEREGTAALSCDDKVKACQKRERLQTLQALQDEHTLQRNRSLIGQVVSVMPDGVSRNSGQELKGRTRTNKIVNFSGESSLKGKELALRITDAYIHSLRGEIFEANQVRALCCEK